MHSRLTGVVGALAVALGSPGCGVGGSHATSPPAAAGPCSAAARTTIAGAAGTTAPAVTATGFVAPSGAAGCTFAAAPSVRVVVTVDGAPQAEQRFERAVVEYGQNVLWAHLGAGAYPQDIPGLGVGADWFAADRRLLASDGTRLLDITVTWPSAAPADARRLAQTLARVYIDARTGTRGS